MPTTSSGGLTVTDGGGIVKFSASDLNFLETTYLRGSFSIPRRDLENTAISTTVDYTLGTCPSEATVVLGVAKIVRADTFATGLYELAPTDQWNCLGGSLLLGTGRCSFNSSNKVYADGYAPTGVQQLTFLAESGVVKAREVFIGHEVPTAAMTQTNFIGTPAWTVNYKLLVGLFDR